VTPWSSAVKQAMEKWSFLDCLLLQFKMGL
jgi:hypothetical protein